MCISVSRDLIMHYTYTITTFLANILYSNTQHIIVPGPFRRSSREVC